MIRFRSKDSHNNKEHASSSCAAKGSDDATSASDGVASASEGTTSTPEGTAFGASPSSAASSSSSTQTLARLGCFKHVVTSRSGILSLYEDGDGHLVVIDPRRFC